MTTQKKYFVPINQDGHSLGVWCLQNSQAFKAGIPMESRTASATVDVPSPDKLLEVMSKQIPWFKYGESHVLKDMALLPGEYYRRMARPVDQHPDESPGFYPEPQIFEHEIANSKGQLASLISRLQEICQTVHPSAVNFHTFGHEVRNILILACTEVEAQWKGILEANGIKKDRYNTNDYVELNKAMLLSEYEVSLTHYPWLIPFQPFKNWGAGGNPTKDIPWYDAYNKVKHDREQNFPEAKLEYAINAVCACMIMLFAQFGRQQATRWRPEIAYFFKLTKTPKWCPSEVYTHPYKDHADGYTPVDFPFKKS